jgi:hypothetical protein
VGERFDRFVGLSELLTGFGQVALLGTGVAEEYLSTLDAVLPDGVPDALLAAYDALPGGAEREAAVASTILGDPKLGPVARNVILLWYCGAWTALPDAWRAAYGVSPLDSNRVVSAEAYLAGLQWAVAGAHPAGAAQQGYGAWALPPDGARSG